MKALSNLQVVNWIGERSFHVAFIKGDPLKQPSAFHLIYKWSLWLGYFEIRKFLSDDEREDALITYIRNSEN